MKRRMETPVIDSALRTPIGSSGKSLASILAGDLGVRVLTETMIRLSLDPGQVDEIILGMG